MADILGILRGSLDNSKHVGNTARHRESLASLESLVFKGLEHLGIILGTYWDLFGDILGTSWLHLVYIF